MSFPICCTEKKTVLVRGQGNGAGHGYIQICNPLFQAFKVSITNLK